MVVGKSPEWLPPGFTEKVKYKNGRKIKYYLNVAMGTKYHSKKDVMRFASENSAPRGTPKTKNGDDNGLSADNKVDAVSVKRNDNPSWLPDGWVMEERKRHSGSSTGSVYKVYTHLSSGRKFYSRASVTQYLNTAGHANTMTIQNNVDNVNGPFTDMSPQVASMTNAGGSREKKRKGNSFVTVATESTTADDLPPGWIKEIKTSKSGNKIRRDPYYTDPVSGYVFHSKLDALRYLKTNDISSCAHRPQKREGDDVKLNENEIPIDNVEPSLDLSPQSISMTNAGGTLEKKRKGNSSATVAVESTTADGLPPGWIKEIKTTKSGNRIRKEQYYTDPVSGYVFRSRLDASRYLKTNDIGSCVCKPQKRELDDVKFIEDEIPIDNVEPLPELPPQSISRANRRKSTSITNTDDTHEKKRKGNSSVTVATESTTADDLPPGWIKEIKTTKCGNRIRKDPYYIDPVSGYVFRSKLDALRYVRTNDINSCACRPQKRDSDGVKFIENEVPIDNVQPFPNLSPRSTSMTHAGDTREKKRKGTSFETVAVESTTADGLPPGWIKEIKTIKSGNKIRKDPYYIDPVSGYIFRSKLDALRYVNTNDIRSCVCKPHKRESDGVKLIENEIPSSNPANENLPVHMSPLFLGEELNRGGESSRTKSSKAKSMTQKRENRVSKEDAKVTAGDVAICSPVSDALTKQQLSGNGNRTKVDSRKSRKQRDLNLPLRTSKRLAGHEPEMSSNLVSNENSAGRSCDSEVDIPPGFSLKASGSIPLPSDIESAKVAPENASLGKETRRDIDPLNEVVKPPAEGRVIPEEQSSAKIIEKQESHICSDFGDSWSDPLEFALKTLRGEIPIEDTLPFPSCFNEQFSTPYNQADECLKQSQPDAPIIFQNKVASNSESLKQHSLVDQSPPSSSAFSAHRNIGFTSGGGFNSQSSSEAGRNKFNP